MSNENDVIHIPEVDPNDRPPTRLCSICGNLEDPEARQCYIFGWICPECGRKIRTLLDILGHFECKDCENWVKSEIIDGIGQCSKDDHTRASEYYCADFQKRKEE